MEENNYKKQSICDYLKEGLNKKDSAALAGIDESTLYRWIKDDASFASQIEENILVYKQSLIKKVNTYTEKDGRFALKVLEKRFPKEWGHGGIPDVDTSQKQEQGYLLAEMLQTIFSLEHQLEDAGLVPITSNDELPTQK